MRNRGGRPSDFTPELAQLICDRVETHGMSLKRICAMYDDMPHHDTIFQWRAKYEQFSVQYLASRQKQAHVLFETSLDDIEEIKEYQYVDEKGATRVDPGMVAAQKALANHKTFMASKIRPKDYGVNVGNEQQTQDLAKDVAARVAEINKQAEKDY